MDQDLISENFADNATRQVVKYNIRLLFIVIVLFSVYSVFNLWEWYSLFQKAGDFAETTLNFYLFRVRPFSILITTLLAVYQLNYIIKGQRLILRSLEEQDVSFFNAGYSFLNKAGILSIIGYSIITISVIARYFLKSI